MSLERTARPGNVLDEIDELRRRLGELERRALTAVPEVVDNLRWYNVRDYGAVGDGVTNDGAAIQAAMDAAAVTGGQVYLPRGEYLVTALAITANGLAFAGAGSGSIIKSSTASTSPILDIIGDRISVRDLVVYSTLGAAHSTKRHGLRVAGDGLYLDNVEAYGCSDCGVYVGSNSDHVSLVGLYCHDNGFAGCDIDDTATSNITVLGGTYINNYGHASGAYGITIHSDGAHLIGVHAAGNYYNQIDAHPGTGEIIIEACTVRFTGTERTDGEARGIAVTQGGKRVIVANNICQGNGASALSAIYVGNFGSPNDNALGQMGQIEISGNLCYGWSDCTAPIYVRPYVTKSVSIVNNHLQDCYKSGGYSIYVTSQVANADYVARMVRVTGNQIYDSAAVLIDTGAMIDLDGNQWTSTRGDIGVPFNIGSSLVGRVRVGVNRAVGHTGELYNQDTLLYEAAYNYVWSHKRGDVIYIPPTSGAYIGKVCTVSGTLNMSNRTGNVTSGSKEITSLSSLAGVVPGMFITISGITFGGAAVAEIVDVDVTNSKLIMLGTASGSASGATVTFPAPTFKNFGLIA